jgi:cysteine synthase B
MVINSVTELVGNTPLLKVPYEVHGLKNIDLYIKLELFNPFGSVKDRIAWGILKDMIPEIKQKGKTVIEFSSGNTGKAISAIANIFGINYETVTNRVKVQEVADILHLLGGKVEMLPGMSECPDPNDPSDPIGYLEKKIASNPEKYFHTDQYKNSKNFETHKTTTAVEIYNDIGNVDYIFGGLGTTGSTRGLTEFFKEKNDNVKSIGIVSEKGDYIPGIRHIDEMQEVGIFQKDIYAEILSISSKKSIDGMLELIRKLGVLAGPTTGAIYGVALEYLKEVDSSLNEKKKAVMIACDRVEWYLSYIKGRRPEIFGGESREEGLFSQVDTSQAKEISAQELSLKINKKENSFMIVDTRSSASYRISHIPGSLNFPQGDLENIIKQTIPFSQGMEIIFVCPTGEISKKFSRFVEERGYTSKSLVGGITAWRDNGFSFER